MAWKLSHALSEYLSLYGSENFNKSWMLINFVVSVSCAGNVESPFIFPACPYTLPKNKIRGNKSVIVFFMLSEYFYFKMMLGGFSYFSFGCFGVEGFVINSPLSNFFQLCGSWRSHIIGRGSVTNIPFILYGQLSHFLFNYPL